MFSCRGNKALSSGQVATETLPLTERSNIYSNRLPANLPDYISPETEGTGLQLFPLVSQGIMATDRTVSAFGSGRVGNRYRFGAVGAFRPHQVKL